MLNKCFGAIWRYWPTVSEHTARALSRTSLYYTILAKFPAGVGKTHYGDVIMGAIASQITSLKIALLNRLFRLRSKKTSKLRVTGLCAGNSPETGEFPAQMASNAENVSIWWRHHVKQRTTLPSSLICWLRLWRNPYLWFESTGLSSVTYGRTCILDLKTSWMSH